MTFKSKTMNDLYLYAAILGTLAVLLVTLLFVKSRSGGEDSSASKNASRRRAAVPNRDEDGQIVMAGPRARGRGGQRMRRPQQQSQNQTQDEPISGEESGNEEMAAGEKEALQPAKMGKKKMEKMQAKADKKLERETEQRIREERKKQMEKEDEERKKADDKEKEESLKIEEEERLQKEEKDRKEMEEYLKLKEAFSVEEEGFDENVVQEGQEENQLQAFISYIKETKVVLLEDLAAHFKMKTQDAIDRVTKLTEEGHLTGVIDDRGKFIFVSQPELEAVAKFIRQRGRVSISELAENSNRLITLNT